MMTDQPGDSPTESGVLRVEGWPDPVLDELGHDPRSLYVERFWLPIMGPSSVLLLRRLATRLDDAPDGFDLDIEECSSELGLGRGRGKQSPIWRTIERIERFRAAHRHGRSLLVRRHLDSLGAGQTRRLPPSLATAHERWMLARLADHEASRRTAGSQAA